MLHPPYGELTECSLIWKRFGQRLPNRADRHDEEDARDAVGGHPCSYISSRSSAAMYPYSSRPFQSSRHASDMAGMPGFEWRCCRAPCGLRLVFIVWGGDRKNESNVSLCWSKEEQRLCEESMMGNLFITYNEAQNTVECSLLWRPVSVCQKHGLQIKCQ